VTDRTGFIVLHRVESVSGAPVDVEHSDRTAELPTHVLERPGTELRLLVDTGRAVLIDPRSERVV
jgi:hypothetical protein